MNSDSEIYWYLIAVMIYILLLCLLLYPYYRRIGFKPIFYLMLFTHFIYGLGVLIICLLVIGSYNQIRITEMGQRLENSIIRNDLSNTEDNDVIIYRYIGESVLFCCKSHPFNNKDVNNVVWTHNGLEINPSFDRINITVDAIGKYSRLLFEKIEQADYGVYSCHVQPHQTENNQKQNINKVYFHPDKPIQTFYLKCYHPKVERLFVPPGGILQLDIRYHTLPTDHKSTIRYTINQKPINIQDDRTLYNKCSFFVYQYWLLFQYGYFLYQLQPSSNGSHLHGIKIVEINTNFCVNAEFYGTYKFFVQSSIVEKSTGRTKLVDFEYPITYEVVPRRPNIFDSNYFLMSPSKVAITNETSQCWLNAPFDYQEYCEDILEVFKSVPALYFTLEFIIFITLLLLTFECFQRYIYFLNALVACFIVYVGLDSPFQIINQHRKSISLAQAPIESPNKEKKLIQIYISYVENDMKDVNKLKQILKNILNSPGSSEMSGTTDEVISTQRDEKPETHIAQRKCDLQYGNSTVRGHVFTRDDGGPNRSVLSAVEEYVEKCNVFIIYASAEYVDTCCGAGIHVTELSFIVDCSSEYPAQCLLLLNSCSKALDTIISNPYVEYGWYSGKSDAAKINTLKRWIQEDLFPAFQK